MINAPGSRIRFEAPLKFFSAVLGQGLLREASNDELLFTLFDVKTPLPKYSTDEIFVAIEDPQGVERTITISTPDEFGHGVFVARVADIKDNRKIVTDLLAMTRKGQHIDICQNQDVESTDRYTGFDAFSFRPCALPNLNWSELQPGTQFLNRAFDYPILITGMTGGIEKGADINLRLARVADTFNIPMGIGSQRIALDNPEHASIFDVKSHFPNLFLIGNLGFAQLNQGYDLDICRRAVDMVQADALAIHLNTIQEIVQVEGDRDFRNVIDKIAMLAEKLDVPLIIKEVGNGIDPLSAMKLMEAGVAAIDVGGRGGTSWGYIEGKRSPSTIIQHVANSFRDWGIPTAFALAAIRNRNTTLPIIATGGIRNGVMVAKAIALGANMAGIGLPFMRAALKSEEAPLEFMQSLIQELKATMICTESKTLNLLSANIARGLPFANELKLRLEQIGSGSDD